MRYFTLAACCLIHLVIGSVYADSVLYQTICDSTGWERNWLVGGFAVTILALGVAAASYRRQFQDCDQKSVLLSTIVLYMLDMGLLYLTFMPHDGSYIEVGLLAYMVASIIRGGCIGVMYALTVTTVTELFTERRGLCSGLVVMSFGLGSLAATKLYVYVLQFPLQNLMLLQCGYWVVLLVAMLMYQENKIITYTPVSTVIEEPMWGRLSVIFFLNICVGITLLSNLVALTVEQGIDYDTALWLVGAAGVANGLGRIFYSTLSDIFGRMRVLSIALLFQTICLAILPWCWEVAVLGIISVYGGGFAMMPSICATHLSNGTNGYSALLVWWGVAGLVAPLLYLAIPHIVLLLAAALIACICAEDTIEYLNTNNINSIHKK